MVCVASPVNAQNTKAPATKQAAPIDRTIQPAVAKAPDMKVPSWTKTKLANGAELIVSVKRGLPLVSVSLDIIGGALQFEDPAKIGVATLTTQMMTEGTTSRTGDQVADAQQMLGTFIGFRVGSETGGGGFTALSDKLDASFELMADMMLNPSFPADALTRRRGQL